MLKTNTAAEGKGDLGTITSYGHAIQLANNIDLRRCKEAILGSLLYEDSDELFFELDSQQYAYIFKYGVVTFFTTSASENEHFINAMLPYCKEIISEGERLSETVQVKLNTRTFNTRFDSVELTTQWPEHIRLLLLYLSQSVALDYYALTIGETLNDTRRYTNYLETTGRLNIGGLKLKKFIGKVLNIKNRISENLYIFDSPDISGEDQELHQINTALKKKFDLKDRYHVIQHQVDIVKENLELFKDLMFHKESSRLEWIIIILILVEVVDLFILKML